MLFLAKYFYPYIYASLSVVNSDSSRNIFLKRPAWITIIVFLASSIIGVAENSQLLLSVSFFLLLTILPVSLLTISGFRIRSEIIDNEEVDVVNGRLSLYAFHWVVLIPFAIYVAHLSPGLVFVATGGFFAILYNLMTIFKLKGSLESN